MQRRLIGLVVIGATIWAVQSELAVAGDDCADGLSEFFSEQVEARRGAFNRLRTRQKEQAAEVKQRLDDKATWEDRACEGKASTLCDVAGLYRMEECAQFLATHIGFTLDPKTFPLSRFTTQAYYPVASALARIGGRATLEAVAPLLVKETGEARLRECVWIARECLGREGAKAWIVATVKDHEVQTALLQWAMEAVILPPAWK